MRITLIRARAGIVAHIIIILHATCHRLDSCVADHQKIRQKLEVFGWTQSRHWFESQSRRKNPSQVLQPTSPPICKTGTWSCTGEQSPLAVSHWSLKASVGLQVPTPAVRDTVSAPASSLPGSRRLRSTGT